MLVSEAVEEYSFYIRKHSPATQEWYMARLNVFCNWCEKEKLTLEKIRAADIRRYIELLRTTPSEKTGQLLSSYTVHGHARTIRTFMNWCTKEDGLDELVSTKTARRIEMPKVDTKVIETFTPAQIKDLLAACSKESTPELVARDKAIILLLLETGIRAGELCGLTLDNVHLTLTDPFIKVFGKGRKEREVGLGRAACTALHKYISRYRRADKTEQHVFLNRSHKPLNVNGLDQMLYRVAEWGDVEGVHAHKFRHTFACAYLEAGGDLFKLSRLMGHTDTATTQLYLRAFTSKQARQGGISVLEAMGLK